MSKLNFNLKAMFLIFGIKTFVILKKENLKSERLKERVWRLHHVFINIEHVNVKRQYKVKLLRVRIMHVHVVKLSTFMKENVLSLNTSGSS